MAALDLEKNMKSGLHLLLLTSIFALSSCSTAPILDSQHVRPWSNQISSEEPNKRSAIAVYKRGKYELYYLASRHTNTLSDDTLVLVKKLFRDFNFNVLIIESIPYSSGENPKWFIESAKNGLKENFIEGGESALSVIYADEKKIPFYAGEPDHKDIYSYLKSKKYTDIDIIGFYTIRQIPQWIRQREKPKDLLERKIPPFTKQYCKTFEVPACPTLKEIMSWYKSKNGRELVANISNEETAPTAESTLFTQKISAEIGYMRDRYTLKIIQEMLHRYKRVAVVYGSSHFTTLRKSFEKHFCEPVLIYDDRRVIR